jgi:ketosteroid isomerase-like protein
MKMTTLLLFGLILTAGACSQNSPARSNSSVTVSNAAEKQKPAADRNAEEAELRAADKAWSDAAGRKDVDAVAGYMADDGETLPPNAPAAKGKEAVKKGWADILALKDLSIKWEPARVEVADSGEIGYTNGMYEMSFTDPKGTKVNDKGKYLEVWKKVDGKWKCYLDMYSSDMPLK